MKSLRVTFFSIVYFIFSCTVLSAQDYELEDVSEAELTLDVYAKDSTAPAAYLNKVRETYFDYDSNDDGWIIVTEVTERIKILNKEGLKYATKKIGLYKGDSGKELVDDIKGVTYNFNSGQIEKSKLDKDAIFKTERSERWDETAFTMPAAQVGSVVEWSYKMVSPFYKIDDLILQEDIPVIDYYAKIRTPGMFQFRRVKKGYFDIMPKESVQRGGITVNGDFNQSNYFNYQELVAEYEQKDVPALKEEVYIINPDNYRRSIIYELISTNFNDNKREYSTTWEEVARTIFKHDDFGGELKSTRFLEEAAAEILAANKTQDAQIKAALRFVKSKISWNGDYGKYTDEGIDKAYKNGSGNVSEINLLLTALLRECGVSANPVLLGTKRFGIPLFPTLEGYNYVVVGIRSEMQTILLDATDKWSAPNILPTRVYNWKGRMVNKKGVSQEIDLFETIKPQIDRYVKAVLNEDGSLEGELKQRFSSLEALKIRHSVGTHDVKDWGEKRLDYFGVDELTAHQLKDLNKLEKPIVESFQFKIDQAVDQVPGQIFLNPLLFFRERESPFKSDERISPIDFDYPFTHNTTITIELPAGYAVASLPESTKIALPDDMGIFLYTIHEQNNILQVMTRFNLNSTFMPAEYYQTLKEFFKIRIDKENEKVILKKSI
ncbi:transglutaminase domain-containing protein [Leeuwenhoekiella polynyae]|uniref:Transglutaminase superfamily protein n=1 Tax=Leeuwenhoekiella polynyae TaxID=1550906 RepID=A0A4Q0PGM7_9FLAO|nr:transglutaminase domain-containing protein [Leeuwenhoekiella polynyae]RXG25359.1 putative protein DUF3857 [Leeuwenhoekiella polynyae]